MSNTTPTQIVRLAIKQLHESIRANIRNILLTSRGSVQFRPEFGLGAERLLGGGMASIDLSYEIADQLQRYEKRIKLKQVIQQDMGQGKRKITICYEILQTSEDQTLTFN